MTKWIKCSERLPEVLEEVIVYSTEGFGTRICGIAHLHKINNDKRKWKWFCDDGHNYLLRTFTHWMSLPEFPDEMD